MLALIRSLRPVQWLKNGFVLAPLVFSGQWTEWQSILWAVVAAAAFCAAASATYIVNDLLDREADRAHPTKRLRPIASGAVGVGRAAATVVVLIGGAAAGALVLGTAFAVVLGVYFATTVMYSLFLKRAVFVDVLVVAAGFVLRVVGGAVAIDVPVSHWILLCAYLLALYLALGKRRSELVLLGDDAGDHRQVLGHYTLPLVDQAIAVVLGATILAYALYTVAPETTEKVGSECLMVTIPVVLYGLFRYLYLLHRHELGGSPARALLTDRPLFASVLVWVIVAAAIIGFGNHG